jgi:hypothetical protein
VVAGQAAAASLAPVSGLGTLACWKVVPFQVSATGAAPVPPTIRQSLADRQVTPERVSPAGAVWSTLQDVPFHFCTLPPVMARHESGLAHETVFRPVPGALTLAHLVPFQVSVSVNRSWEGLS